MMMKRMCSALIYRRQMIVVFLVFLLTGCYDRTTPAPVVESRWLSQNLNQTIHRVQHGETLYAIAFRYDKDYRQLAAYNQLSSPYSLRVGQVLRLPYSGRSMPQRHHYFSNPIKTSARQSSHYSYSPESRSSQRALLPINQKNNWYWPAHGRVVANFFPAQGKKGIDIASKKGEGVYASAAGVVAYAGSGVRGYGNLIIIKHDRQYLSAYGNNFRNLVHEGQRIKAGQRIADVGVIDRRFWGVHFEIRQSGQPVNPLDYLKRGN